MSQINARFRQIGSSRRRYSSSRPAPEDNGATRREMAQWLFDSGVSLFTKGRHRRARVCFERLVTLMPESAQAHYLLGLTYKAMGDDEKAQETWQQVMLLPDFDDANIEAKQMAQRLLERQA